MFFFAHLFTGIVIGLVLLLVLKDIRILIATAIGAVIPDLVDKPLGHIILKGSVDYGRIYFHTLMIFFILFISGVVLLSYSRFFSRSGKTDGRLYASGCILTGLSLGLLSHELLDEMWLEPVNWFWPFLGQFSGISPDEYFLAVFLGEVTNLSEWIFGAAIVLIFVLVYRYKSRIPGSP